MASRSRHSRSLSDDRVGFGVSPGREMAGSLVAIATPGQATQVGFYINGNHETPTPVGGADASVPTWSRDHASRIFTPLFEPELSPTREIRTSSNDSRVSLEQSARRRGCQCMCTPVTGQLAPPLVCLCVNPSHDACACACWKLVTDNTKRCWNLE